MPLSFASVADQFQQADKFQKSSGLDESTLKFQLNGVTIPTSRLTIERTTDTIGPYPILAAMTITYNHPLPGELIIPGKNTVKVDIDDMVRNHMNQIVQDFNVPSSY